MSETTEATVEETEEILEEELTAKEKANKLNHRFVLWSMGGSIIPIAVLDAAAVIGVQIKLIIELSKIYKVPFSENRIKGVITPLIGSLGIAPTGIVLFGSLVKLIPGIGHLISALSLPVVVGAITYATGKVFIAHFESGGTLLSFDAEANKEVYKQFFKEGQKVAQDIKEKEEDTKSTTTRGAAKK